MFSGAGCRKAEVAGAPPPVVTVMEVREAPVAIRSEIIGHLDSPQNVEVRTRVEAFVNKIAFVEGSEVKKGDLLFELNQEPFMERLAAVQAEATQAEAAQRKAKADLARIEPLQNTGAVSKQDLDSAVAAVEKADAAVEAARAGVEAARLDLGYCRIVSPVDGLIGAKEVSEGDLVGKGSPTLLATISTLDPIWCYCNIAETGYLKIRRVAEERGMDLEKVPLTLILPDGREHPHSGKIVFFDRAVAAQTGTIRMRAEFPNPTKLLRPGMFARIRFEDVRPSGIVVPDRALVTILDRTFVWVVAADQTVSQLQVQPGQNTQQGVLIEKGLEPGMKIILEGAHKVREGVRVMVVPSPAAGTDAESHQP